MAVVTIDSTEIIVNIRAMIDTTMTTVTAIELVVREISITMRMIITTIAVVNMVVVAVVGTVTTRMTDITVTDTPVIDTTMIDNMVTEIINLDTQTELKTSTLTQMLTVQGHMHRQQINLSPRVTYCKLHFLVDAICSKLHVLSGW